MNYLKKYLKTISDRGNIKLSESILKTSDDIGENIFVVFHILDMK